MPTERTSCSETLKNAGESDIIQKVCIWRKRMKKSDFYFDLPEELIAQTPLKQRDGSRLLLLDKQTGAVEHRHFYELPEFLGEGDCLVLNDSRVLPARLLGSRFTGGSVELVLLRDLGEGRWECLSRPGKKTRPGTELSFGGGELTATVEDVIEGGNRIVRFHYEGIFLEVLERLGKMPLPPYIARANNSEDKDRYQTVYSKIEGSVAAPTAGLHFTKDLLKKAELFIIFSAKDLKVPLDIKYFFSRFISLVSQKDAVIVSL